MFEKISEHQMEPLDLSSKGSDSVSTCSSPTFSSVLSLARSSPLPSSSPSTAATNSSPSTFSSRSMSSDTVRTPSSGRASSASSCSSSLSTSSMESPKPFSTESLKNPPSSFSPNFASADPSLLYAYNSYMAAFPSTEMSSTMYPAPSSAAVGAPDYFHPDMNSHHHFNMQDFLHTYYYISMRNYNGYMNYNSHQMSSDLTSYETATSTPKTAKNKRDTGKISKAKKRLLSNDAPLKKDMRNKKRKIAEKLEKECNCRFCYEDHILRMRMQTTTTTATGRSERCKN